MYCTVPPAATEVIAGEIVTLATGAVEGPPLLTVSVAVPLCPSLVALTTVVPALTPTARPVASTVATPGTDDVHVIVRPVSGFPAPSRGVATNWTD
jgi:hypothetical protein